MMGSGWVDLEMGKENRYGQMELIMKVSGAMEWLMVKAF